MTGWLNLALRVSDVATADDTARLLVSIEASQRRFEKQMAAIAKSGADTAGGIEQRFQRSNDNVARGFQSSGKKVEQSLGAQRAAVTNLSFQLNDIAMGLASGTSPFTIMVQQGSQVAQALQGSGGLIGAVKTLGGAFATMVNPVSLASFALIGLVGYAVQYFTSVDDGAEKSEKALKAHIELISAVAKEWGDAVPALQAYAKAAEDAKNVADLRAATDLHIDEIFKQAREQVKGMSVDITDVVSQLRAAGSSEEGILKIQDAFNRLKVAIDGGKDSTIESRELTSALISEWLNTGVSGAQSFASSVNGIAQAFANYAREAEEARKQAEAAIQARRVEEFQKTLPENLGQLSPLTSAGGKFLNPDELQTFRAGEERYRVAGESAAAQMVKGFESFISKAKWDVNAYRVGFGSDTVTRANGAIEKVTKDTVVTLEDAQRDLSRRLVEFQDGIQTAIGADTWRSLNDAQQAALTSIAYNYGSLPKRIVEAIQNGGGPEAVAKAISALGADNGGINRNRRQQEAQSYLSGSGLSLKDAGIGGRSPADLFAGDVQQVQARIEALKAEYAAQAALNPLVNDYGYAVAKARIEQQLLSEAQKAGLEVTPALREQISGLAENYARASVASEQLKESQQRAAEAAKQLQGLGKEVMSGFISDLRSGASASEALSNALNKVLDKLIDIGLESLFSGGLFGGGKGGLLGGFLIPGILHKGGVAGSDGYGHGRAVSPSTFTGAKRYHKGGIAGLQPGEVPAILQRGEVVLPRGTKAGGSQAVHVTVGVSADNNGNLMPFVESVSDSQVKKAAPGIVSAANQRVVPTMAAYQSNKAGAEWR